MKKQSILVLAIVAIVLAASPVLAEVLYNITDLGTVGGEMSWAMAINNKGQIVGFSEDSSGCLRATLFHRTGEGNNVSLDSQNGIGSFASSINNNGQIVGSIGPGPYLDDRQAVLFDPTGQGNHTYLSTPDGYFSLAFSINNSAQVVGYIKRKSLWPETPRATLFDSTGADNSTYIGFGAAYSINDSGQIVGDFGLWEDGVTIPLGGIPYSINNLGQIVGYIYRPLGQTRAALFDPTGQGQDIDLGQGVANSINDKGQIVGDSVGFGSGSYAVLFDESGGGNNINLNDVIDANLGWELQGAECINNKGWIVGVGKNPDGYLHAFLLTPILPAIEVVIDISPKTLNLKSKGKWITCHIWLPEDYNVADMDPNSVILEEEIPADWMALESEAAMVKFSRAAVQEMLAQLDELGEVELLVSGELTDGTIFEGTDTITVIDKGKQK